MYVLRVACKYSTSRVACPTQIGKTPHAVEAVLDKVVPQPFRLHAHHWLILHGRYVCKARRPECWRCQVADLCAFRPKTPAPVEKPAKRLA